MKKIFTLIFLDMLACCSGFAQHILNGTVRNLNDCSKGDPIENVEIDIGSGSYIGFTDANGNYTIPDVNDGSRNIMFSITNYKTFNETINIKSDTSIIISTPSDTQNTRRCRRYLNPEHFGLTQSLDGHPYTWKNYPILVYLSGANALDTMQFNNAFLDT